mmetsp:Transcript_116463/g.324560  ORF Transcript_116463/g.324560 Transcript_116463/m.324560 type:complete len:228 (+) Transcript_116463:905-1588(+)
MSSMMTGFVSCEKPPSPCNEMGLCREMPRRTHGTPRSRHSTSTFASMSHDVRPDAMKCLPARPNASGNSTSKVPVKFRTKSSLGTTRTSGMETVPTVIISSVSSVEALRTARIGRSLAGNGIWPLGEVTKATMWGEKVLVPLITPMSTELKLMFRSLVASSATLLPMTGARTAVRIPVHSNARSEAAQQHRQAPLLQQTACASSLGSSSEDPSSNSAYVLYTAIAGR